MCSVCERVCQKQVAPRHALLVMQAATQSSCLLGCTGSAAITGQMNSAFFLLNSKQQIVPNDVGDWRDFSFRRAETPAPQGATASTLWRHSVVLVAPQRFPCGATALPQR